MPHSRSGKEIHVGSVVIAPYPGADKDSFPKIIGVVERVDPSTSSCNGMIQGVTKVIAPGVVTPWQGGATAFSCGDAELIV